MNNVPSFRYQIDFADFQPSDTVKTDIENNMAKLERLFGRIIFCHVSVRAPHLHKRKHIYHINIQLKIPGADLSVNHEPAKNMAHSDIHLAIRDAFKALHRQLEKKVKTKKGREKLIDLKRIQSEEAGGG